MKKPILLIFRLFITLMLIVKTSFVFGQMDYKSITGHLPQSLCFVENVGQWDKQVQYRADIPSGYFWLTPSGFHYTFYNKSQMQVPHGLIEGDKKVLEKPLSEMIDAHHISIDFLNAKKIKMLKGDKKRITTYNYFLGNDKNKWGNGAKSFEKIIYPDLYTGIDAQVFSFETTLKYEFHVKAFAKPSQIKMQYKGVDKLYLEEGNLIVKTSLGEIKEQKPYSYQIINGKKIEVITEFYLENNVVSFNFPQKYDTNYDLVIDPVLIFSTYSGSFVDNWGSTATFDEDGNLYAGGILFADGTGFPVTQGAFQVSRQGIVDIGIMKFNPQGTNLIYCTYLGGNNSEFPHSLVVNNNKELIVFGTTGSNNFPVSAGAFSTTFQGGTSSNINAINYSNGIDMFITRFNVAGSQIIGSTYLGGSANDGVNDTSPTFINNYGDQFRGEVIVNAQNEIYIASTTKSPNFPTQNAFQTTISGTQDGVVAKFNPNLTQMIWGSYFGGSGFDAIYGVKLNSIGELYACGVTLSPNLRANVLNTAPTPYRSNNLGSDEGFLAKISPLGTLQQVTYIGTNAADQVFFVDFDPQDNPHVLGLTFGAYPVSSGVYSNPNSGQFVQKFDPDLTTSTFSTRIGAGRNRPDISPTAFMVNTCGNIYIAGWGSALSTGLTSVGLPVTPDAVRTTTDGGDFYFMILQANAVSLLYGTFFGANTPGDHVDGGTCRFEKSGIIYHSACASCGGQTNSFPTTSGAVSATNNSPNCNNAAFKFDIGSLVVDFNIFDASTNVIVQQACQFPFPSVIRYQGVGATTFLWKVDGVTVSTSSVFNFAFPSAGDYVVTLTAGNPVACLPSVTVTRTFRVSMITIDQNTNVSVCKGNVVQLTSNITSSNPFTYSWLPTTGLNNPTIPNPIASPTQTTTYILTATDNNGCVRTKTVKVTVIPPLNDDFDVFNGANVPTGEFCLPAFVRLRYDTTGLNLNLSGWTWTVSSVGTFNNQSQVNFTLNQTGSYTITLTVNRTGLCPESLSKSKTIIVKSLDLVVSPTQKICVGGNTQLSANSSANVVYSWSPVRGLSNPNIANPIASPTQTTLYLVTISDNTGCQSEANVLVEVEPEIKGDFDWEYVSDCGKPTTIQLKPNFQGGNQFLWTISDGTTYNTEIPNAHIFKTAGTYTITALVKNGACQKTIQKTIEVENNALAPPNVITPNNDGKNDTFVVPDRQNYSLEIYTRIGTSVFKSDNYLNDWGKDALVGTYYYLLTSPKGVKCKGWIEVMK